MPRELIALGIFAVGTMLAISSDNFRPNDWRLTAGVLLVALAAYTYGKARARL